MAVGFAANQDNTIPDTGFNDIYLNSSGQLATVDKVACLVQTCKANIWLWLGEYDFNNTLGMPYKQIFNSAGIPESIITYQLNKAILLANDSLNAADLAAFGISEITRIQYTVNNKTRKLNVDILIKLNNNHTVQLNI